MKAGSRRLPRASLAQWSAIVAVPLAGVTLTVKSFVVARSSHRGMPNPIVARVTAAVEVHSS